MHWTSRSSIMFLTLLVIGTACDNRQETSSATGAQRSGSSWDASIEGGRDPALSAGENGTHSSEDQNSRQVEPVERPANLTWSDPRAMAIEALNRCKGSDPRAVLAVATNVNQQHSIEVEGNTSVAKTIYGPNSWRAQAITAWSGTITAIRRSHEEARVQFAELENDEVAVVVLRFEENQWRFHDIRSHHGEAYQLWGRSIGE